MLLSGDTLRILRQLRGMKQEVVAKQLGISQPAYSQIERSAYVDCEKFELIVSILGFSKAQFKDIIENHLYYEMNLQTKAS